MCPLPPHVPVVSGVLAIVVIKTRSLTDDQSSGCQNRCTEADTLSLGADITQYLPHAGSYKRALATVNIWCIMIPASMKRPSGIPYAAGLDYSLQWLSTGIKPQGGSSINGIS